MATAIATPEAMHTSRQHEQRAYWSVSRAMALAAGRQDHEAVRGLLRRREHLLAALTTSGRRPSRALGAEVEALDAQTMLALGVEPPRPPVRLVPVAPTLESRVGADRASGYGL